MKDGIKKAYGYLGDINGILLILYSSIVFSAYSVSVNDTPKGIIRGIILSFVLSGVICPLVLKFVKECDFSKILNTDEVKPSNRTKILFFIVPFVSFLLRYIAYYPGGFFVDSMLQLYQTINNSYSDWHPVIQTLLSIKLPMWITRGWFGSIILFQIIGFSVAIYYALSSIAKYINTKSAFVVLILFCFNPQINNFAVTNLKDVSFAICALVLITYYFNIYFTDGKWLKSHLNTIVFIVAFALTTLIRHNAILFTIPLACILFLLVYRKKALIIMLGTIVLIAGIKFPLYSYLNVRTVGQGQEEILGLPLTVIGNVVSNDPDSLDDETKEFAYKIAPKEIWENEFDRDYNSIKWGKGINGRYVINEYGSAKIISYMMNCFKSSPVTAFKGLVSLTGPLYSVLDEYDIYYNKCSVAENELNIKMSGVPVLRTVNELYSEFCEVVFTHLFFYLGSMHLLLILFALAKCSFKRLEDLKKLLMVIPVFLYNFGTMLLLTGAGDSTRFFFYTFLVTPLLLIVLLKDKVNQEEIEI